MGITELLIIAIGVSMDAFAVSICKGLSVQKIRFKHVASTALWFGGFQALMPLAGYCLGASFADFVSNVDHWVAFVLLAIIGSNMIKEACSKEEEDYNPDFSFRTMFALAVATSIDALASGIAICSISLTKMLICAACIGIITFTLSGVGVFVGNKFGQKYKSRAELAGGIILILLGLKMLLEGLGIIG